MKSKEEVEEKLELVMNTLAYGNIKKESDFMTLRGQISVLKWMLEEEVQE